MKLTDKQYIFAGEIAHYLSLALNITLTATAMLGLPSKSTYDSWWTSHGFCVIEENATIPTELLCGFLLTSSAALIAVFLSKSNGNGRKSLLDDDSNPLLTERLRSSVFALAAHGLGHAFGWFVGMSAPPIELSLEPAAVANILMLTMFWVGVLRNVVGLPTNHAAAMTFVVLVAQYMLSVPSELAFTYSQSIILLMGSLEQLRRKDDYLKTKGGHGARLFFVYSLQLLPLFFLFPLEMFLCKSHLSGLGGHAIYDLYLSIAPFMIYYAVTAKENNKLD